MGNLPNKCGEDFGQQEEKHSGPLKIRCAKERPSNIFKELRLNCAFFLLVGRLFSCACHVNVQLHHGKMILHVILLLVNHNNKIALEAPTITTFS